MDNYWEDPQYYHDDDIEIEDDEPEYWEPEDEQYYSRAESDINDFNLMER